jgi:chaperone modulatory protein CbpM
MTGLDDLAKPPFSPDASDVQRWIANGWVRPRKNADIYVFDEIDLARIRLIHDLRYQLQIDDGVLPLLLSLLDQLYAQRRRLHDLGAAISVLAPDDLRRSLLQHVIENQGAADPI